MALGNANSSAQSRGKNKPVIVKRRKEIVLAKSSTSFVGTLNLGTDKVLVKNTCSVDNSLVNVNYFHNGSSPVPVNGDKVYSRPRYNDKFLLKTGFYKVRPATPIGPGPHPVARYSRMRIVNGVVIALNVCP
jgi:hypothetical protein